jgi:hypothetical protein
MENNLVMIHVRFAPDGSVTQIGERPPATAAQEWYDRLSDKAGMSYQALSGGRGVFRLQRSDVEALKTAAVN